MVNGAMSTWGFSSVSTSHLTQNTPMKADDFFWFRCRMYVYATILVTEVMLCTLKNRVPLRTISNTCGFQARSSTRYLIGLVCAGCSS